MLLNSNGKPCNKLPNATPKISDGTKPPMNNAQSQALRHFGESIFARYSKPTGRKNNAASTNIIAKKKLENEVAYTVGHAAKIAPPPVNNQTWLPSQ